MNGAKEKRIHERFMIPVLIEAPALSDVPLVPEDVSAGGFMVIVPEKPDPRGVIECTIQVLDGVFENCEAKVLWVREGETNPPEWVVGLSVQMAGKEREHFEALLRELLKEIRFLPENPAGE